MANILIVGQKELVAHPIFKQDKNMLELYIDLKKNNNVEVLFVHKETKLQNENLAEKTEPDQKNKEQEESISKVKQYCIKDMMKDRLLKQNINKFIKEHNIETIIFMSNYMAKLVMPYIENLLTKLNIICDLRLTIISSFLQQYKYEKEKDGANFYTIYKSFKIHFIRLLPILEYTDNIILDEDCDLTLLKAQKVDNIILPEQVKNYVKTKNISESKKKENTFVEIIINRSNYFSNLNIENSNEIKGSKIVINETKKFNLIDDINNIIKNSTADYIVIHNNKIEFLPKTIERLINNLSFNDNLALCSPVVSYSKEKRYLNFQFENQRLNNFSNWNEDKPLAFSECVIIKKKFFHKIGLFDNKFKTIDYSLFDFILRLYQIKAYYCTMSDIFVFKSMNIPRQISLFKEDKNLLCNKWGESLFSMGI